LEEALDLSFDRLLMMMMMMMDWGNVLFCSGQALDYGTIDMKAKGFLVVSNQSVSNSVVQSWTS